MWLWQRGLMRQIANLLNHTMVPKVQILQATPAHFGPRCVLSPFTACPWAAIHGLLCRFSLMVKQIPCKDSIRFRLPESAFRVVVPIAVKCAIGMGISYYRWRGRYIWLLFVVIWDGLSVHGAGLVLRLFYYMEVCDSIRCITE